MVMKKSVGYEMASDRAVNALLGEGTSSLKLSASVWPRGGRRVALTTIITGIFDEKWLLEIEAIAAA